MVLNLAVGIGIVWRVLGWPTLKGQALKAAVRGSRVTFRLSRKLQQLVLEDPDPSPWRDPLPAAYPSGPVVDLDRQWWAKRSSICNEIAYRDPILSRPRRALPAPHRCIPLLAVHAIYAVTG